MTEMILFLKADEEIIRGTIHLPPKFSRKFNRKYYLQKISDSSWNVHVVEFTYHIWSEDESWFERTLDSSE